jgi:acetoin utilization deacetylase AcuC-like enzyme
MSRPVVPVGYVIDEVFLAHTSPPGHPERPERLAAVRQGLLRSGLKERGTQIATRRAKDHEIGLVHTASYFDEVARVVPGHAGYLDEDTFFAPGTWDAALAAVGAAVDLTRATLDGRFHKSFAVVRPPGHHAEPDRAMGFCLFNNVAIAAAAARAAGAARVAIVDWDVHHGNGTQNAFYRDPNVMYVSTHQWPLYPGTGAAGEIGAGEGVGANINVPLPPQAGDAEYAAAFDEIIVPALRAYQPDVLFISSGFDAFVADPLAQMNVSAAGYRRMAACLRGVADEVAGGRLVAVLEGGYDLGGLDACAGELFDVLACERPERPAVDAAPGAIAPEARQRLDQVKRALAGRWGIPCP